MFNLSLKAALINIFTYELLDVPKANEPLLAHYFGFVFFKCHKIRTIALWGEFTVVDMMLMH